MIRAYFPCYFQRGGCRIIGHRPGHRRSHLVSRRRRRGQLRSSRRIGLSTADRTALNAGADDLDSALAQAARTNGDTFADVWGQFAGHEICDSGSWLNSVDIFAISSSYHPNASGQELGYLPVFTAAAG